MIYLYEKWEIHIKYCPALGCPPEANPNQGFKGKEFIWKMRPGNTSSSEKQEKRKPINVCYQARYLCGQLELMHVNSVQ